MSTRYKVTTVTRLNGDGVAGTWMLMASPIVHGLGVWWCLSDGSLVGAALAIIAGLAFLGGFVLLLIGRDMTSWVEPN